MSEGGKDQMSHRFWEGIRRGEYCFADAPSIVKQKESEQVQRHLGVNGVDVSQLSEMPDKDQRAFTTAYNSGNRNEANRILSRDSVSQDAKISESVKAKDATPEHNKKSDGKEIDLRSIDLKDIQLADSFTQPTAASLPDASGPRVNSR